MLKEDMVRNFWNEVMAAYGDALDVYDDFEAGLKKKMTVYKIRHS